MDYAKFEILSFDCYGTLIDWKKGILDLLYPVVYGYRQDLSREELFELFMEADREYMISEYKLYKDILVGIMDCMANKLNLDFKTEERTCLADHFDTWEPFPDTVYALKELKKDYKLAVISNVDDDLFSITQRKLEIEFNYVITAQQVRNYKPADDNFMVALDRFGADRSKVLHVAQSIYHDIVPTNRLGWNNVWVNRYNEPERTDPDEYPNLEVPDLESFVRIINIEENNP